MRELRPYQGQALADVRQAYADGKRRIVMQLPTGGGKTLVAAHMIRRSLDLGHRIAFVAPRLALIDQAAGDFRNEGIDGIGVMQADHMDTDATQPVQICSVDTLTRRGVPNVNVVIVDECHLMRKVITDWMKDCPHVLFIGLSATPWSIGLGRIYDHLVIGATTRQLIDDGYLSPFQVFAPEAPDLSGVPVRAGDYAVSDLSEVMDQPHITGSIVESWFENGRDLPTLVYGVDRGHAQSICRELVAAGVSAEYQDGFTSALDRAAIRARFESGETTVLTNCETLTTGIDVDCRCLVLARPTKSRSLYVQIVGRALRTAPGKERAIIIDHTETTENLGFVTDIHQGYLSMGKAADNKRAKYEKPKPVAKHCTGKLHDGSLCGYLKPAGHHECANCGFKPPLPNNVQVIDGKIVPFDNRVKSKKPADASDAEKLEWYRQFMRIQQSGRKVDGQSVPYKHGWIWHKFEARFKESPKGPQYDNAEAADVVSLEVESWVRRQNQRHFIARKHAMARGGKAQ